MVLKDICIIQREGKTYKNFGEQDRYSEFEKNIAVKNANLALSGKIIAEIGELYETKSDLWGFVIKEDGIPISCYMLPKKEMNKNDCLSALAIGRYFSTVLNGTEVQISKLPKEALNNIGQCYYIARTTGVKIGDNFGIYYDLMSSPVREMFEEYQRKYSLTLYCYNLPKGEGKEIKTYFDDYMVAKYLCSGTACGNAFMSWECGYCYSGVPSGGMVYPNTDFVFQSFEEWQNSPYYRDTPPLKVLDLNSVVAELKQNQKANQLMNEHYISIEEFGQPVRDALHEK